MKVLTIDYTSKHASELFCQSLKDTGFGVLTKHPISPHLIEESYQQWERFFYSEDKFNYVYQKPAQDGYFPFRTEKAKNSTVSDLKEFYHFYPWGRIPSETKSVSFAICDALTTLASELLTWIEKHLPTMISEQLSQPLKQMIIDSPNTLLRVLHYPPINNEQDSKAVRAAPHEDINLITLLPAATAPGLEVQDIAGAWHSVDCDPGNIVVNVGDMLQMCTQQYFQSTTHRVINPPHTKDNTSRFSMPLFLHPRPDVKLAENCTAEQYLNERLKQIGIF